MAMNATALATAIRDALGFSDKPVSSQSTGMAAAIVTYLSSSAIINFLPGTITGTAPPSGGPLQDGAGSDGVITGLVGADLASEMKTQMGLPSVTAQLTAEAGAICDEVMNGTVAFSTGSVTGVCGNTPTSPGPLTGQAAGGQISGISASAMADAMASAMGGPATPQLTAMCTAIATHIMGNAVVVVAMPNVTGTCSAGGGPVTLGAAAGGSMS